VRNCAIKYVKSKSQEYGGDNGVL